MKSNLYQELQERNRSKRNKALAYFLTGAFVGVVVTFIAMHYLVVLPTLNSIV